jgi:hypothetical protein
MSPYAVDTLGSQTGWERRQPAYEQGVTTVSHFTASNTNSAESVAKVQADIDLSLLT